MPFSCLFIINTPSPKNLPGIRVLENLKKIDLYFYLLFSLAAVSYL